MAVWGNYAYLAEGEAGVEVIEVSDPANPRKVGGTPHFRSAWQPTVGQDRLFEAADDNGLFILEMPPSP